MLKHIIIYRLKTWVGALVVLAVILSVGLLLHRSDKSVVKLDYPAYYSFDGNYVFSLPKSYDVDEQSIAGLVLIYQGALSGVKNLDDLYGVNGISVQPITDLSDHSGKAFKNYVTKTFLPDIKKNLDTDSVQVKFDKINGQDVARTTVNKGGKAIRYILLKNGQHPAAIVSKSENSNFKKIEQTIQDIENSDLKDNHQQIQDTIVNTFNKMRANDAKSIYDISSTEFKSKSNLLQLSAAITASTNNIKAGATVRGVSYTPGEFTAALSFNVAAGKNIVPPVGKISFKLIDGQWKLFLLSLPTDVKQ